ncbi:MAG: excinuclease ABC subunit UvrB [Candidatus Omnitrophica bacterium]|nr:excinuclease ABC subunit UvrB [Candidatus Omnitrophota bacterium]
MPFKLVSKFKPCGDQPHAIKEIIQGFQEGAEEQVLVGVTGSGKTYTMANIIEKLGKPTLVISHNKTLAAQLYSEFRDFFPFNAVEYFVSYYDYYQPEAYIPHTDTYIAKDASINENLDRLRLSATSSLLSRNDTIVVSSVSCIYGLGSPEDWEEMLVQIKKGEQKDRDAFLSELIKIQYIRNDADLKRGMIRVRGEVVEIFPSYDEHPVRVEFFGDTIEDISVLNAETFEVSSKLERLAIYPAKHFVTTEKRLQTAINLIQNELKEHLKKLHGLGKILEAERLQSRTQYDIEMLREIGYCSGIENYSRHVSERLPGSRPFSLIDYFEKDFLVIIDESHVTVPQIKGMYNGDRARKETLVEHGFRLPSALDNRPLNFNEFEGLIGKVLYASATPGPYELNKAKRKIEQLIRPTGLVDPEIEVRPIEGQIDDLIKEVKKRAQKQERTLITTLTKRMAEDLARYLSDVGIRVRYIHSELDAIERVEVLKDLRQMRFDCLVGINLLREGLDLPEVALVIILDADKEGFLRSEVSLIQTAGRAARHENGHVIMYAADITKSMHAAISETGRRRKLQREYNRKHNITPRSIQKTIKEGIERERQADKFARDIVGVSEEDDRLMQYLIHLKKRMEEAARTLDFDRATILRDKILDIQKESGIKIIQT